MAEPKKTETTPPAPTPAGAPAPAKPPEVDRDKLAKERKEVEALEEHLEFLRIENRKKLLQEEIDKLKNGGLSRAAVKRRDEAIAKREATIKETIKGADGPETLALYQLSEKSYQAKRFGGVPQILEAGEVIRIPIERLPGESMLPVKLSAVKGESKYEPIKA